MSLGIKASNIYKSFNGTYILKNLSLSVKPQESMVIIGQSGSGKSVFLKCLLGLYAPNSGQLWIGDQCINTESSAEQEHRFNESGVVFQSYALFDSLTLWENVAFCVNGAGHKKRDHAIHILKKVGLSAANANLYPFEISGGMKRRVSIARAIALSPKYLFFDEPTEGLDPVFVTIISQLIRNAITQLKATAITITHNIQSANIIADTVTFLSQGKINWQGTPQDMISSSPPVVHSFVHGFVDNSMKIL